MDSCIDYCMSSNLSIKGRPLKGEDGPFKREIPLWPFQFLF